MVATPRGRGDGREDGGAGQRWSSIRTPSPERRHVQNDMAGAGASQHRMPPLLAQLWHTPCAEAPSVLAMAVPPPPQALLLGWVPADAHAPSIGSVGHPHGCALPCKYSRGGRVD